MCGLALTMVTKRSQSNPVLDEIQIDSGARAWSPKPQPYAVVQASASTSDGAATRVAMSVAMQRELGISIWGEFSGHG